MDAKYINPFLEAFNKTLEQFGIRDIKRSNIKKKSKFYSDLDVSALICLGGGIQGYFSLSMPQDTAKNLASAMMMGMPVPALDDMAKSAIGEISSMIAGASSTMLVPLGVAMQISPPSILLGPSEINPIETLAIEFDSQLGKLELNIGIV